MVAITDAGAADAVGPRAWVRALGGEALFAPPGRALKGVDVGLFRFGDLPERLAAPPIDHHYLSFTLRGPLAVERVLGGGVERGEFRRGTSLLMAAGQANGWRWTRPTDELQVYLDPAVLDEVATESGLPSAELIDRFAFDDPILRSAALALVADLRDPVADDPLLGEVAARAIALHLLRRHCARRPGVDHGPAALAPARLRRVRAHVDANLDGELGLGDLAAAAGLSRAHFARAFRRATGQTPHRFVVARRIDRARHLLATTELDVAEIALRVGYATQSHFGQVFRAATGTSPAAYRRGVRR